MTSTDGIAPALELVRRYQHGEEEAGFRLIELYWDRVLAIVRVRFYSSPRIGSQPAGVMCDAFLAAIRDFTAFELPDEASFIQCMVVLVSERIPDSRRETTSNEWRSPSYIPPEFKIKIGPMGLDLIETGTSPNSDTPPSTDNDDSGNVRRIEECLSLLSSEQREMIILHYYAGLTWEEVANELKLPGAEDARKRHERALVELSKLMRETPP